MLVDKWLRLQSVISNGGIYNIVNLNLHIDDVAIEIISIAFV